MKTGQIFMKERELYAEIRSLPPFFIRLDGRGFHHLSSELTLKRPFDDRFSSAMVSVCSSIMQQSGLSPVFAYTFSDEISIYFKEVPFNGRIEKINSVIASFAASAFTITLGLKRPMAFDSRIIPITPDLIQEYLSWRQDEAWRNHINAYSQSLLINEGYTSSRAASMLKGASAAKMHDLCFTRGVNLAQTPAWQRRGILLHKKKILKKGYNPITGEETCAERNILEIMRDPPLFSKPEGITLIGSLLGN